MAVSADHTTLAGGHANGSIFTWEIARSARPFLHITPIISSQTEPRRSDGHISGVAVIHVGFLGTRHTALVSADGQGMAFSHLATRGMGAVARIVKTTRILGRYPDSASADSRPRKPSAVLAFSPLPLGNVEQTTDSLGLVAMLTPYLLVIVSTTPVARTQYKVGRPKEVAAHGALTSALAWFPAIKLKAKNSEASNTKLVYCWSNVLTVMDVVEVEQTDEADRDKPPSFDFKPRGRWRANEAIVAVQWISRSVLAVMTITQQLLILEDNTLRVTDTFDLIHKHIYHVDFFSSQLYGLVEQLDENDPSMHGVIADAFYMSFKTYKGRLFLLGVNDVSVGSLSNWADRLLALMEAGDFIGAIRLATSYYLGETEKLTVGLPDDDDLRQELVQEKLLEMMLASLKYAFGRNEEAGNGALTSSQLSELADACVYACISMENHEFLFDEVYPWYEESESQGLFLDVLEPYIVDGSVRTLSPSAVKSLITYYSTNHAPSRLEEIICLLNTSTLDIDQVTTLCKQYNLYDAFIYVWTRSLGDYISPFAELLDIIKRHETHVNGDSLDEGAKDHTNAMKMFPYLSYTLTGRIYPTGDELPFPDDSSAKAEIYDFLFSGRSKGHSFKKSETSDSFSNLRTTLAFDSASFMSMLNEAFEDSFLNETAEQLANGALKSDDAVTHGVTINRQYIINLLLEIMESGDFGPSDTIYLDMFIARNLPKYPQYILLSGSTIQQVLVRLCKYPTFEMLDDCQLSAEYLLSMYRPPDIYELIPLFKEARFFRILKSVYKTEKMFSELLLAYLEDPEDQQLIFVCIRDCLRPTSSLGKKQRRDILTVIKENALQLSCIDIEQAAQTIENMVPELHETFLHSLEDNPAQQFHYLDALFSPEQRFSVKGSGTTKEPDHALIERYVQLLCCYKPSDVAGFVDVLKVSDLQLDSVLPSMEESGVIDAAVILLARQGEVRRAMDRLTKHLSTLEAGLAGILQNAADSPDAASTMEAVTDLMDSLTKYSRVGSWLCQEQTKTATRSRTGNNKFAKRGSAVFKQPLSFEEHLWLDLIEVVVRIARNISPLLRQDVYSFDTSTTELGQRTGSATTPTTTGEVGELTQYFRSLVQRVFTALLTSATQSGETPGQHANVSFLRVLRAFLTRAAAVSPSLSELRSVIGSIFSTYAYEESILSLANGMLDKDLFVHVDEIAKRRQRGWRPRRQMCEICRQRVWGPGSGGHVWEAWRQKQAEDARRGDARRIESGMDLEATSRMKGKAPVMTSDSSSHDHHNHYYYHHHRHHHGHDSEGYDRRSQEGLAEGNNTNATATATATAPTTAAATITSTMVATGTSTGTATATATTTDNEPLIVFGCRHTYHRSCLIKEGENQDVRHLKQQQQPLHHRGASGGDGRGSSGVELRCLLCR